jgi:hypothetical protein
METIKILASRGAFYAPPGKVNRVRRPASHAPAGAPNKQERARGCLNRSDGFLQSARQIKRDLEKILAR